VFFSVKNDGIVKSYAVESEEELAGIALRLLKTFPGARIFAIYGAMGAGKTTLIKALCKMLNVKTEVQSPTFSIINEYFTIQGEPVYHFDFYRIRKIDEVYDIGYEEYFFSGAYCFLEWPELVEALLPEGCIRIKIEHKGHRIIRF
jgi:tRNA threonylcarbamoyladenosine biosynthesis protein TsaE